VADAEKQVPAYVSSVNYGRIIMFRLEADKKEKAIDVQAALNYGTGAISVGVDAKGKYDSILQNSSITVVTMGGSADVASQAVSARSAADLAPIIKGKNAVYSKNNPGVPIAYTIKFLKDSTIAKMGSTTDFTTTDCTELPNLWIKLVHNGWYTAHFDVTWDEPGRPNNTFHSDKNKDYQQTLGFPGDATNIRVNISNDTGLVWEPRREIINRPLVPNELNKCLIIEGTTLGSGKKFEACEKPPPDDLENKKPQ
jgi:thiol-activated cytolysin